MAQTQKTKHRSIQSTVMPESRLDLSNWWIYIHEQAGRVHHNRIEHEMVFKQINLR